MLLQAITTFRKDVHNLITYYVWQQIILHNSYVVATRMSVTKKSKYRVHFT